jgi:hypothetical protein
MKQLSLEILANKYHDLIYNTSRNLEHKEIPGLFHIDLDKPIIISPLEELVHLILLEIPKGSLYPVVLGVKELLCSFLTSCGETEDLDISKMYIRALKLIHRGAFHPNFPFALEMWEYTSSVLCSLIVDLLKKDFIESAKLFLELFYTLGKEAAAKGFPTSMSQSHLRQLENKAIKYQQKEIASLAKNFRFNME